MHAYASISGETRARESSPLRLRHAQLFGMSLRIQRVFMYKRDRRSRAYMYICTLAAVQREQILTAVHVRLSRGNLAKYYNTRQVPSMYRVLYLELNWNLGIEPMKVSRKC